MSSEPGGPDWVQGEDGDWYPPSQAPPTTSSSSTVDAPDPEGKRRAFALGWVTLVVVGLLLLGLAVLFLWFVNENSEEQQFEDGAAPIWEPATDVGH